LLVVVLLLMKLGYSGNHYNYALTSGNPVISATSVAAGLQHGDTLDIPANAIYTSFTVSNLNGIAGDSIVIRFLPGSRITNNIAYAIGEWTNASFIKVIGLNSHNNGSTVVALRAGCHSLRFTQCNFINDAGMYSVQPAFVTDDPYGTTMYFTGSKSQTYYDVRIDQSTFNGFLDVYAIAAGTDTTRSVILDFEFDHNTFKNITQDAKIVPNAMSITGYNFKIHDNVFDSLAYNNGACDCSHNSWITIYGNGDIYDNKFSHTYGQDMRIVPMKFSGLAGYAGPISVYNNIATWHASYSFLETSPNNGYGRASGNGGYLSFTDTRIYFNTVYRTNRASNNGDYAGMVADVYAQAGTSTPVYNRTVFVHNNVIINPEQDRTWDPATRGYIMYFGSGIPAIDTGGNRVYQTLAQAGITDSVKLMPGASSVLVKAADASSPTVATDIYGTVRSAAKSVGAAEAVAGTVVPVNQAPVANAGADTTVTLPANTAVLSGSKSTDADGTIAAYAWTLLSGPSTTTITNANTATASVASLVQGTYSFRLQVTDNAGATGADTMKVVVNAAAVTNIAPVASAGVDTTITLPANTAVLNGSKSKDTDGTIAAYAWTLVSGPSTTTITNANTATASVSSLVQGSYSFRLLVTDNTGASAADTVVVNVSAAAQTQTPVAGTGTGLRADYYNTNDLSGNIILTRTDATVNFDWITGSPASVINADNFSARWTGQVQAAYSETYMFYTNSDDGVRVWVNGQKVVDNWTDHAPVENSGTIALVAGQKYNIVMEYYEKGGGAVAQLSWSSASTPKAIIPQTRLYPAAITTTTGTGTGLKGEYYNTSTLSGGLKLTRTDATVNFDWGTGSPASGINADNFSARWSGQVQAVYSETYTFYTNSDDGVRLWVNGQKLVDNWTAHGTVENSGTITLAAGQKYTIVMEYFEKTGSALAKLLWSSASTTKAIVPQSQLYPAATAARILTEARAAGDFVDELPVLTAKTGLAPNPVMGGQATRLTFNSEKGGPVTIQVIDVNGRIAAVQQVTANAGSNTTSITTAGLTRGMYVVRVADAGNASSFKLLVQ